MNSGSQVAVSNNDQRNNHMVQEIKNPNYTIALSLIRSEATMIKQKAKIKSRRYFSTHSDE